MQRHELINSRIRQNEPDIIFIGDSITEGWERAGAGVWAEAYGGRIAANLGISGDRTQHVLWRLENGNVDGISPKLAVVMIGTNNSRDNTPEQTRDGIIAIVRELRRDLPNTKILLLGIFPRGENAADERRQTNSRVNTMVAGLADGEMVHYLDIGAAFLESDGSLSREIMPDLLHLSEEGYGIWAEAMEPVLSRLLDR
jgi:beta-glucosidase